ncbi:hypothetical protein G3J02_002828 [Listeria monocytogenes]|nr:hypothetical protein [Listeria monocytogenes]EDN9289729.1 hypothetical protein [Listeria monocytogenes]EDN9291742.1 hypothetical protein [Listeria monocytogenes]EDN9339592.1 hypothetical protein [Listeria monocytogenes]EDN9349655.1 hypothetical protein [Listeria monocytogenes]
MISMKFLLVYLVVKSSLMNLMIAFYNVIIWCKLGKFLISTTKAIKSIKYFER